MLQIHAIARDGPELNLTFNDERGILGRAATADIRIDHRTVSKEHAEIFRYNGEWWIRDLGARNGVIVHGQRVDAWKIHDQTQIAIGNYLLTCRVDREDGFDQTVLKTVAGDDMPGFQTEHLSEGETRLASRERLERILQIRPFLMREAESGPRYAALCEQLIGDLMSATTAFVIDVDMERPNGPYGVLGKCASGLARGPVVDYISRTIMRHLAESNTPVMGSNRPIRQSGADSPVLTISEHSGEVVAMGCRFIDRTELGHVRVLYVTMPWHMLQRDGAHSPDKLLELSMIAEQVRTVEADLSRRRLEVEAIQRQRDTRKAQEIQQQLLPDLDAAERLGVGIRFKPCQAVGGDYVDLIDDTADGHLLAVLADVSGKGLPAAMIALQLHSVVRTTASRGLTADSSASELARSLDYYLRRHTSIETFATAMIAVLHPGGRRVTLLNAGHPPALLWDGERARPLGAGLNMMLGVSLPMPSSVFEVQEVGLEPGQRVLVYSDGLDELIGEDGSQLGLERLAELFCGACSGTDAGTPVGEIAERVRERLEALEGDRPQSDDQTFIVL